MKRKYFRPNEKILLVGEGNFSFAVALVKLDSNIELTATCYESSVVFESGIRNIDYLKKNGVRVKLGVDATKLKDHFDCGVENFDCVVFNFPHVGGKMRIERNRNLLRDFFCSVENYVRSNVGVVLVSLCNGQGGTPFDKPQRRRDDSWQIIEMAAQANFLMTRVEPFCFENFSSYNCTGYRGLEKAFVNSDALVHIFHKTDLTPDTFHIALHDFDTLCRFKAENENKTEKKIGCSNWDEISSKFQKFLSQDEKSVTKQQQRQVTVVSAIFPNDYSLHVTFTIDDHFDEVNFYSTLYCLAGNVIDCVKFLGEYKFPNDSQKVTRTYEIRYKSFNIPLYRSRVIDVHKNLVVRMIEDRLNVVVTK